MKTVHEMIQIMQAYERGEQIEILDRYKKWEDIESPGFNWISCDYRIKPKPEFRPFKSVEEFLEAQKEHGTETSTGELLFINSDNTIYIDRWAKGLDSGKCSFEYLFKNFKFADGTPCGRR